MNLFEKIFNYQLHSRLDESGAYTITSHERSWLKAMLEHSAADDAFDSGTLEKLRGLLAGEADSHLFRYVEEKAGSIPKRIYHPLLRTLRRMIMNRQGVRVSYQLRNGEQWENRQGFPYKLEYSMVKREWYLIWYPFRERSLMMTKLAHIRAVEEISMPPDKAKHMIQHIADMLLQRKQRAVIEVIPAYNAELSRILYAFSCFEKEVAYNDSTNTYRIALAFPGHEAEFVLSKIRFLGLRVRVAEGDYFKHRMLEAATKALARYGDESV
ncbi:WYL domain-containing protein [Paenibacillus pinihumi]|uniref:WYL domain-containing protein n=1 Tax=Paenibacillus pinihumi TaxID=669462 RepID=UPI00041EADF6|nr:WYL domain-containing protein [Paenibacillus pinihumi]